MFPTMKPTFGQSSTPSFGGFASPSSAGPAAGTATPFGQNTFNKPTSSTTGFSAPGFGTGGSSLFGGAPSTNTGLFGGSATPGFGQAAQQPQQAFSGFSAGTSAPLFSATSGVSGFSQPKPAFGGFGTSSPSGGLFGAQPSASVSTPVQAGSSLFNQGTSIFGSSGGFGSAGTAGSSVALGTPVKFNAPTGTDSMAKNGLTQTINTRHQCITCMKEYETKSLEELRLEDLQAGRRGGVLGSGDMFGSSGTTSNQNAQGSLFGATATVQPSTSSGGLFGENKALFGGTATTSAGLGAFGSTTPAFGGAAQNTGGLFGKPTGFGASTTTTASGFSFNANNNNVASANPFGAASQNKPFGAATGSLFGGQQALPTTTPVFGAQPTTGFGNFGVQQNQQQSIGLFGQNKIASPFGIGGQQQQQQQPAGSTGFGFGQSTANATQGGGLFGAKPRPLGMGPGFGTQGSVFGAPTAGISQTPAFGTTAFGTATSSSLGATTTPSLFGQSFNKPTGTAAPNFGFGQPQATPGLGSALGTGGLFGSTLGKPATASGGLFGSTGGSLFGGGVSTSTANPGFLGGSTQFGGLGSTGATLGAGQTSLMGFNSGKPMFSGLGSSLGTQNTLGASQASQTAMHQQMMALVSNPYGDLPLFRNLPSDKLDELRLKPTNPAAQKAALSHSPSFNIATSTKPRLNIKPRTSTPSKKSLFEGLEDSADSPTKDSNSPGWLTGRSSVKNLQLRPRTSPLTSRSAYLETSGLIDETYTLENPHTSWLRTESENLSKKSGDKSPVENGQLDTSATQTPVGRRLALDESRGVLSDSNVSLSLSDVSALNFPDPTEGEEDDEDEEDSHEAHPAGIVLRRAGYFTIPTLAQLADMTDENGRCEVDGFTIGRENYGNLYFEDKFDVANLNLDEIVHFRHREVVVYPDEDRKPELGQGLNRRAQVTLDRVFPSNKKTRQPITDLKSLQTLNYEAKLRHSCTVMGTRFLEYRPDTGSWVFKVEHFSKYGVTDSDDEEEVPDPKKLRANATTTQPPQPPQKPTQTEKQPLQKQPSPPQQQNQPSLPPVLQTTVPPQQLSAALLRGQSLLNETMMREEGVGLGEWQGRAIEPLGFQQQVPADAHKLRLMKASFFDENGENGNESPAMNEAEDIASEMPILMQAQPIFETPPPSEMSLPVRVLSKMRDAPLLRRPHQRPAMVPTRHQLMSAAHHSRADLSSCIADVGLFHGHRFCPSWGTKASVVMPRDLSINIVTPYKQAPGFTESLERLLGVQLQHSISYTEEQENTSLDKCPEVPRHHPRPGVACLQEQCAAARTHQQRNPRDTMIRQVLEMCLALWGPLEHMPDGARPALVAHARREALSDWLQQVICEEENEEEQEEAKQGAEAVLKQLRQGRVSEGVQQSQQEGDHYTALILAQAGSGSAPRRLVQQQIQVWQKGGVTSLVSPPRLRSWLLAGAGLPLLAHEEGRPLNALQGLDWLSCMAAHLWYLSSPAASIPDVLDLYEQSFSEEPCYSESPVPLGGMLDHLDVRFHLLKLFSKRSHPLEPLLSVQSHFPNQPLDYSLSWVLMCILDTLGYTHVSEYCQQSLHLALSEQLEAAGLWHWSTYVLQHISSGPMRHSAVEQLIGRHVTIGEGSWSRPEELSPQEEFIVERLGVPVQLVFEAKAVLASSKQRFSDAALHLLYARDWNGCHRVLVEHLAADSIINRDIVLLSKLLHTLEPHSSHIEGWSRRGQVFLDHVRLLDEIKGIEKGSGLLAGRVEAVKLHVISLCSQLGQLPCETPKDRLCQSEIAHHVVAFARTLRAESSPGFLPLTELLRSLPLPEDMCLQEVRHATSSLMDELPTSVAGTSSMQVS